MIFILRRKKKEEKIQCKLFNVHMGGFVFCYFPNGFYLFDFKINVCEYTERDNDVLDR